MLRKIFGFILDSVQALVLALSVFVLLYLFVAQPNQVHGSSMYPNFYDKEFILTEKISYRFKEPARGEVVVFKAPPSEPCSENECEYIKRVIGLPGDTVKIVEDQIWINGNPLREDYIPSDYPTNPGSYLRDGRSVIIPPGEYLFLGDNRPHSRDGREFGPVPKENIVGRALIRYWPLNRLGIVGHSEGY